MKMLQVSERSGKPYQLIYDIWFGKFEVSVNQMPCKKVKRAVFTYDGDENERTIQVKGNMFTGFKLIDEDEMIVMMKPLRGFEWFLVLMPLVLLLGGAIGGALGGLTAVGNAFVMRHTKSPFLKFLISVLFTGGAIVLFFIIAIVFSGTSV